jgi:hypothetical protein
MKNTITNVLDLLANKFSDLSTKIKNNIDIDNLKVLGIETSRKDRCISILLSNNNLKTHKVALQAIFNTLKSNDKFINFGKNKIIYVTGIYEDQEFALHSNVYINNNTTFDEYYESIKSTEKEGITDLVYLISNLYVAAIPMFRVRV